MAEGESTEFEARVKVTGDQALDELRKRFQNLRAELDRQDEALFKQKHALDPLVDQYRVMQMQMQQQSAQAGGLRTSWINLAAGITVAKAAYEAAKKVFSTFLGDGIRDAERFITLSRQFGIGVEQLSALGYQADQTGVSLTGLVLGVRQVGIRLAAAKQGNDQATASFKALGLGAKDIDRLLGQDLVKSAEEVVGRLAKVENQALRSQLSFQLAGRSGRDMLAAFQEGGTEEFRAELERLGAFMSDDLAKRFKDTGSEATKLSYAVKGVFQTFADQSNLIEGFGTVFAHMTELLVQFRQSATFDELVELGRNLMVVVGDVLTFGEGLVTAAINSELLAEAADILNSAVITVWQEGIKPLADAVGTLLVEAVSDAIEGWSLLIDAIGGDSTNLISRTAKIIVQSMVASLSGWAGSIWLVISGWRTLRGDVEGSDAAFERASQAFKAGEDAINGVLSAMSGAQGLVELSEKARAKLHGLGQAAKGLPGPTGAAGAGMEGMGKKGKEAADAIDALRVTLNALGRETEDAALLLEDLGKLPIDIDPQALREFMAQQAKLADVRKNALAAEKAIAEARQKGRLNAELEATIRLQETEANQLYDMKVKTDELNKSRAYGSKLFADMAIEMKVLSGELTQVEAEVRKAIEQALASGVTNAAELKKIEDAVRALATARKEAEGFLDLFDTGASMAKDFWDSVIIGGRDFGDFMKTIPASFGKVMSDAFFRGLKAKGDFDKKFQINIFQLVKNAGEVLGGSRGLPDIFEKVFKNSADETKQGAATIVKGISAIVPAVESQMDLAVAALAKLNAADPRNALPGAAGQAAADENARAMADAYGVALEDLKKAFVAFEAAGGQAMAGVAGAAQQGAAAAQGAWGGFFTQLLQLAGSVISQLLGMFGGLGKSLVDMLSGLFGGGGGGGILGGLVKAVGSLLGGQGGGGGGVVDTIVGVAKTALGETGVGGWITDALSGIFGQDGVVGKYLGTIKTFFTSGNMGALVKTLGSVASTVGGLVAAYQGFSTLFSSKAGGGQRALGALQGIVGAKVGLAGVGQLATALEGVLGQMGFEGLSSTLGSIGSTLQNLGPTIGNALKSALVAVAPKLAAAIGVEVGAAAAGSGGGTAGGAAGGVIGPIASAVGVVGSLAGIALSVKGLVDTVNSLRKQMKGDEAASRFGVASGVSMGIATGVGAGVGFLVGGPIGAVAGAAVGAAVSAVVSSAIASGTSAALDEATRKGMTQAELEKAVKTNLYREGWGAWFLNVLSGGVNILFSTILGGLMAPDIERIYDKVFQETVGKAGKLDINRQLTDFGINKQQRELFGRRGGAGRAAGDASGYQPGPFRQQARDLTTLIAGVIGAGTENAGRINRFFNILTGSLSTGKRSIEDIEKLLHRITRNVVGNLQAGLRTVNALFEAGAAGSARMRRQVNLVVDAFDMLPDSVREAVAKAQDPTTGAVNVRQARQGWREGILTDLQAGVEFTEKQAKKLGDAFLLLALKLDKEFGKTVDVAGIALATVAREADRMKRTLSEAVRLQATLVAQGLQGLSDEDLAAAGEEIAGAPRGRRRRRARTRVTAFAAASSALQEAQESFAMSGTEQAQRQAEKAADAMVNLTDQMEKAAEGVEKLKGKKLAERLQQIGDIAGQAAEAAKAWGEAVLGLIGAVRDGQNASEDFRISIREEIDGLRRATETHEVYNDALARNARELALATSAAGKLALLQRRMDLLRAQAAAEIRDEEEKADKRREKINEALDAANKELQSIQGLAGIFDSVTKQIEDINAVALDPMQMVGDLQGRLDKARRDFETSTGDEKLKAAQTIQELGGELLNSAAEAFGPGSAAFAQVQRDVLANLGAVRTAAKSASERQVELLEQIEAHQAELEKIDKDLAARRKTIEEGLATKLEALAPSIQAAIDAMTAENKAALEKLLPKDAPIEQLLADPMFAQLYVAELMNKQLADINATLREGFTGLGAFDEDDTTGGGQGEVQKPSGFNANANAGGATTIGANGKPQAAGGHTFNVTIQINIPAGTKVDANTLNLYTRTAADEFEAQLLSKLGGKLPKKFGT